MRILASAGVLALAVATVELGAWGALRWHDARLHRTAPSQARSPVYADTPWADDYWREWRACCQVPEDSRYVGDGVVRLAPFAGETINVGADGLRRTVGSVCTESTPTVAMFGSSMLWGHGSRDAETIPSRVAQHFARDGSPVCVRNYAQWGTTTRRAALELAHELERGAVAPRLVVFYAGSYETKESVSESEREFPDDPDAWVEEATARRREAERPGLGYLRCTNLWRLLGGGRSHVWPPLSPEQLTRARETVFRRVRDAKRIADALGREYGFASLVVWHPYALAQLKPLSPDERRLAEQLEASLPGFAATLQEVYATLPSHPTPGFHDLSRTLAGHPEPLFIDAGHLGPRGNELLADALYPILSAALARQ